MCFELFLCDPIGRLRAFKCRISGFTCKSMCLDIDKYRFHTHPCLVVILSVSKLRERWYTDLRKLVPTLVKPVHF